MSASCWLIGKIIIKYKCEPLLCSCKDMTSYGKNHLQNLKKRSHGIGPMFIKRDAECFRIIHKARHRLRHISKTVRESTVQQSTGSCTHIQAQFGHICITECFCHVDLSVCILLDLSLESDSNLEREEWTLHAMRQRTKLFGKSSNVKERYLERDFDLTSEFSYERFTNSG